VVLLDATVLSNFARIGQVDLLRLALPSDAATTPQVLAELERGVAGGRLPAGDWGWLAAVQLTPPEEVNLARVRLILGDGEASCIGVALERGCVIFTDDRDARRYARRQKLRVSGTLGVLLLLVERKHLTVAEADACLREMIAHDYRSPVTSIAGLRKRNTRP
jgi:predicted nucleic acid-binding protein